MLELFDDIDGILVELMDNQIDYDFDIKDKREEFLRFDIRFFPKFIKDRYFPYLEFYGRDGKLKPYIKDALLTLDTYLKNNLMIVKVHSLFGSEGMMMSIPEFVKIEGIEATKIRLFSIGVSVNLLERGRRKYLTIKEKLVSPMENISYSLLHLFEEYGYYYYDVNNLPNDKFWTITKKDKIEISPISSDILTDMLNDILSYRNIVFNRTGLLYNVDINKVITNVGMQSCIIISYKKNIEENMKNILSFDKFNEELVDITSHRSASGKFKEVDKIYSEENPHIKSRASYLLLKDKYKKAELEDIKKLFTAGMPVYKYKTDDPKLTKILVTLNNLQFLKHRLKEDGELRCEYCDKGPLVIYDIFPDELDNLIGNPYHRLNKKFDPVDGATCDHKNPQSLGGDKFDYSNLAVCCYSCNQRKRSMPYDEWMRKIGKKNENLEIFNESIDEDDLKDYCESNLAYLVDDGLKVEPDFYNGSEYGELDELSVCLSWHGHIIKWSDIKDHIIPFFHRLRNDYELDEVYFGNDPDTAEYHNKFFRFTIRLKSESWLIPKEVNLSYDELENLPDDQYITKIIFWIKI